MQPVPVTNYDEFIDDQEIEPEGEDVSLHDTDDVHTAIEAPLIERGTWNFITPRLVAALDKCKVSDRYATHILAAVAEALGHCLRDLVINRESIRLCRDKYREQISQQIKNDFQVDVN